MQVNGIFLEDSTCIRGQKTRNMYSMHLLNWYEFIQFVQTYHSSQFQSLCSTKCSTEMFQWNASKFAIFYIYENPKLFFTFFISCNFMFLPNECPGVCRQLQGHSLGKNIKLHEMKNGKCNFGFSYI